MIRMKNDQYRQTRGGKAQMIDVNCTVCGMRVLHYQKDGDGQLLRCYINRIFSPEKYERLQYDKNVQSTKDLGNLVCDCGNLLGVPTRYKDGRLAYRLIRGKFQRLRSTGDERGTN